MMGRDLVWRASDLDRWGHLSPSAHRVLLVMCRIALDKPSRGTPAARYFGGDQLIADMARITVRSVERGRAELVQDRAISKALHLTAKSSFTEWELFPQQPDKSVGSRAAGLPVDGGEEPDETVGSNPTILSSQPDNPVVPTRQSCRVPYREEDYQEDYQEDVSSDELTSSLPATHDRARDLHELVARAGEACSIELG